MTHLPPVPPRHLTPTTPSHARSIHHTSGAATTITKARNALTLARDEIEAVDLDIQRMTRTHGPTPSSTRSRAGSAQPAALTWPP
ncbi:MAG: hypothetical protein ACRDRS_24395 [Pseudonocardiaceae bacterium]